MNRFVALLLALVAATVTVSSACAERSSGSLAFTLTSKPGKDQINARFRSEDHGFRHKDWSSSFVPSELTGLDVAALWASGLRPLRFSLIREAGRIDCSGDGRNGHGSGKCSVSPDPGFTRLIHSTGIILPTREQAFGLVSLDVRPELLSSLEAARYPRPTIDDLMALTAIGVTGEYVKLLAQAGYRPGEIHDLFQFRAMGISPEWIGSFARAGFANLPPNELVQLNVLNITPDFILAYERLGYGRLPAARLVQLKALGITPEFVRAASREAWSAARAGSVDRNEDPQARTIAQSLANELFQSVRKPTGHLGRTVGRLIEAASPLGLRSPSGRINQGNDLEAKFVPHNDGSCDADPS